MDIERDLADMEAELRAILPEIARTKPELFSKHVAIRLANAYDRKGIEPCVPCPICGGILTVSRVAFGEGRGSIWTACPKPNCTWEHASYGP